jgi:hypothetical protein
VCFKAFLKIGGDAYIALCCGGKALEKIDILHPFAPERCCILKYRGGKNGLPPEALIGFRAIKKK